MCPNREDSRARVRDRKAEGNAEGAEERERWHMVRKVEERVAQVGQGFMLIALLKFGKSGI